MKYILEFLEEAPLEPASEEILVESTVNFDDLTPGCDDD